MNKLRFAVRCACALATTLALSACGQSKTSADPNANISGIATPSSVSVVTATNTQ